MDQPKGKLEDAEFRKVYERYMRLTGMPSRLTAGEYAELLRVKAKLKAHYQAGGRTEP